MALVPREHRRVVFLRPAWDAGRVRHENTYNRVWPPLSSLYVATALKNEGIPVEIRDVATGSMSHAESCSDLGPHDLVFFSTADVDRWQCPNVEMSPIDELSAALRSRGASVILTGTHGSVAPDMMLRRTEAHAALLGEPEEAAIAIATGQDPSSLSGVAHLDSGKLVTTGPAASVDLTRLPNPDYSLLNLDRYRYELLGDRFALFEGSRGCPFPCAFCSRVLQGRKMRRKEPSQLIAEVERAVRRDGVRSAYFIDLEFHLGGKTNLELCSWLARERPPLRWTAQLRSREITDEWLDAMKAAGCRLIHCGIESGSPHRLKLLDKVSTVEEMSCGVEKILARGIEVLCFFIIGFPGETPSEIEETVHLALRLNPTYASFHLFTPYPGTDFALTPSDGALFVPPTHPEALPLPQLTKLRKNAYLRFYTRPSYAFARLRRGDLGSMLSQARIFAQQVFAK